MKTFIQWWLTPKFPLIHLEDKTDAVKIWFFHPIKRRLAKWYLFFLRKATNIKVIAITGSSGKTTTKDMLASILQNQGKTKWTEANIDPIYNIPTTILRTPLGTKYLILEMGVEFPGEMDFYLWLAKPDIGIITNIFPTHLEFLGDVGGVFSEKSKLVKSLAKNTYAVLNAHNKQLLKLKNKLNATEIWFGNGTNIISSLERINTDFTTGFYLIFDKDANKKTYIKLPISGNQFITSALAASAAAKILNISLEKIKIGLENFTPPAHRMRIFKNKNEVLIIDDTYNNNPMSAEATIRTFESVSAGTKKIIVFGDMRELGNWDYKYHKQIGEQIAKIKNLSLLICIGPSSKVTAEFASIGLGRDHVSVASDWLEASKILENKLRSNTALLVKGSRSIGLDKLVDQLS